MIGAALVSHGVEILITRRFEYLTEFLSNIGSTLSNKGNVRLISDEILYLILIIPGLILLSLAFFGCSGAITQIHCLVCGVRIIILLSIWETFFLNLVFLASEYCFILSNNHHRMFNLFSIGDYGRIDIHKPIIHS